uniref:Uncharacterized protein n=2 Tax=Physcomitrium patens TaxID=3218 RepID=A0A2K1KVA2_PHYPA|nr:hypothetical protein PHYPA_004716 [Physcomitrium patens]
MQEQPTDMLTKLLGRTKFELDQNRLNLRALKQSLLLLPLF